MTGVSFLSSLLSPTRSPSFGAVPSLLLPLVCGVQVNISCNDCEVRSEAKFHFLGLECAVCKGYNTARV